MVGKNNLVSIVIHHCQGMIEFEADGFRKISFNCMCMSVLLDVCLYVHRVYFWCLWRLEENPRSPGPRDSCKSPSGC